MTAIRRFTTKYEPVEDRVQMLIELEDEVQVLWLTRRLLSRLIPPLLKRLDAAPSVQAAPKPQAQVAQRFSQQAAVSTLKPQKSVAPTPETPQRQRAALVTSLDVKNTAKGVVLDFKGGDELLRSLPFTEAGLRQWLSVLHQNYRNAGWQEGFWPTWMTQPAAAPTEDVRLN